MNSSRDIFKNFLGTWVIKRVLGNYGTAEGIAKFTLQTPSATSGSLLLHNSTATPDENEPLVALYREELEVKYNSGFIVGQNFNQNAYKEYFYLYDEKREKIIKKFMDDRLFYELAIDFKNLIAEGEHLCDKDFYRAKYNFKDSKHFSLVYDVKGPEKDYKIETEFTKIDDVSS